MKDILIDIANVLLLVFMFWLSWHVFFSDWRRRMDDINRKRVIQTRIQKQLALELEKLAAKRELEYIQAQEQREKYGAPKSPVSGGAFRTKKGK